MYNICSQYCENYHENSWTALPEVHQAGHLVLGDGDGLAAPVRQRDVRDFVLNLPRHGGCCSGPGLVFSVATRGKGKKSGVTASLYPHQSRRVTTCWPLIGWFPVNTLLSLVRKYTSKDPFPNFFWSMKVCQNLLIYIILSTSATLTWLQSHVTWEIKINGENRMEWM